MRIFGEGSACREFNVNVLPFVLQLFEPHQQVFEVRISKIMVLVFGKLDGGEFRLRLPSPLGRIVGVGHYALET